MNIKAKGFELREYQKRVLNELKDEKSIGLFLGTGSGKTLTSLKRVQENPTNKVLIICPSKIVDQWQDVMEEHFDGFNIYKWPKSHSIKKIDQELPKQTDKNAIVINFAKVSKLKNLKRLIDENWTIIIDESHRIKSYGTKRKPVKITHAMLKLGELTEYKILLTATPTQGAYGGYLDYYPQLKFIDALEMDYWDFKGRYVIETHINYGTSPYPIPKIVGYRHTDEIDAILMKKCRRYVPKFHEEDPEHIKVKIPKVKSYDKIQREFAYNEIMIDNVASKRVSMKQLTTGRISGTNMFDERFTYDDNTNKIDWLQEFLEDTDETVAIFYQYNITELGLLKDLMEKIGKKYIVINGKTKNATELIKKGGYDVVLGQFQAMSESIDGLHKHCHIEIFFAMPESSLVYKQAIGRIDRDGQEFLPIYYYLLMEKTLDEDIYEMIEKKIDFSEVTLNKLLINKEGKDV